MNDSPPRPLTFSRETAMMEGCRRTSVVVMVITMLFLTMMDGGDCALHKVGSRGWIQDFNYTEWSTHDHFYVDDWLLFVFDKHYYNVLEVNKTSYENCNDQGFIKNITKGGRDVYQLTEARPYYFLSSGGYCWNGMKLSILVQETAPTPAPALSKSTGPPPPEYCIACSLMIILSVLVYLSN